MCGKVAQLTKATFIALPHSTPQHAHFRLLVGAPLLQPNPADLRALLQHATGQPVSLALSLCIVVPVCAAAIKH
jgi:hypothetical protein